MRLTPYPQCCKAQVIHDFGYGHSNERGMKSASKEEVTKYLDSVMKNLSNSGIQVLFACPTIHQTEAIEALQEYGFFGAPQEELDEVAHLEKLLIRDEKGQPVFDEEKTKKCGYNVYQYEDGVHQMIPMFFLIPPPVTYKRLKDQPAAAAASAA